MKKYTLLFVAMIAMTTQAASIDWKITGLNSAIVDYLGNPAANTTIYLVSGTASDIASITDASDKDAFSSALSAITIATTASDSSGKKPATTTTTVSHDSLIASQDYTLGMLYLSEDSDGNGFFRVTTALGTAYDPNVVGSSGSVSTSWANMKNASWTKGYTAAAVPEPSTAVLALAGLALLLKRRRA